MNFASLLAALSPFLTALGPIAEPVILASWTGTLLPGLQAQVAKITNVDEQFCANAALTAVDSIVQYYIKKV